MKNILILFISLLSAFSFGQDKVKYNGLNRAIPDNIEIGVKGHANYYFAKYKIVEDSSIMSTVNASESIGGGFGFFGHFELSEHAGIQTELNFQYRKGNSTSYRQYDIDTARTLYKEDLSSFTTVLIEIPVYLKFHWEFTPIRQGHWKAKSQLGLYVGPRLVLSPFSKRDMARATTTRLYDNTSVSIQNDVAATSRYNSPIGVGVALGVDYELWNGFIVHAAFYRGLTSHVRKSNGYQALDNRLEVGIGYRFN